jgi:hypothetical protein
MIIITDKEVSNHHGTGVLQKAIIDYWGDAENIVFHNVLCDAPFRDIKHYLCQDIGFATPPKRIQFILFNRILSTIYFLFKRPQLPYTTLKDQNTVFIITYKTEMFWLSLLLYRLFPQKKYVIYIMDFFNDFEYPKHGKRNQRVFRKLSSLASVRICISHPLAGYLNKISGTNYVQYYGPRKFSINQVNEFHSVQKGRQICLVGNAWVETVLSAVDEKLERFCGKVVWYTGRKSFEALKSKYKLKNFEFGGQFQSDELLKVIQDFKYGLVPYGADVDLDDDPYLKKLQQFSIPSKIIDYCIAGVEPLYIGPNSTACFDYLKYYGFEHLFDVNSVDNFFCSSYTDGAANFVAMKKVLENSSIERFRKLALV